MSQLTVSLRPVIATGIHDPSLGFTNAYFHTPAGLRAEVTAAGFQDVDIKGIEGPAWTAIDGAGPDREPLLLESALICARMAEGDDTLTAMSGHLLAVARKT